MGVRDGIRKFFRGKSGGDGIGAMTVEMKLAELGTERGNKVRELEAARQAQEKVVLKGSDTDREEAARRVADIETEIADIDAMRPAVERELADARERERVEGENLLAVERDREDERYRKLAAEWVTLAEQLGAKSREIDACDRNLRKLNKALLDAGRPDLHKRHPLGRLAELLKRQVPAPGVDLQIPLIYPQHHPAEHPLSRISQL